MRDETSDGSTGRARRVERLLEQKAIAVLRTDEPDRLLRVAEALLEGGVSLLEVTMTVPDALSVVRQLKEAFGVQALVGVGSVLNAQMTLEAVQAGAEFVVGPVFRRGMVDTAHQHDVPALPGALTPTEIQTAHEAGADVVKVFPAKTVGRDYLRTVKAPLPHLNLMPTGGVGLEDAGDWLRAGASVVGVGSALVGTAVADGDYAQVTRNAWRLRQSVEAAREDRTA